MFPRLTPAGGIAVASLLAVSSPAAAQVDRSTLAAYDRFVDSLVVPLFTGFVDRFLSPRGVPVMAPSPVSADEARKLVGTYRDQAIPRATVEGFFVGLLFGEGDARVGWDAARQELWFQPPGAERLSLEKVGEGHFRTRNAPVDAELVFHDMETPEPDLYVTAGPLGSYSFERIPSALAVPEQLLLLLGILGVFALWCVYLPARALRRRLRHVETRTDRLERVTLALTSGVAVSGVGGFLLFSVLGFQIPSYALMTGVPLAFPVLSWSATAAALLSVPLTGAVVLGWRRRGSGRPARLLASAVALAGLAFLPFCLYWGLFGGRI